MSLNLTLSTALSGLLTSQKALDVVSNNISNVNTEGYTRKTFNPESVVLSGKGSGVQVSKITRQVEQGVLDDMREAKGLYSQLSTTQSYYGRLQDMFGQPADNNSMAHLITDLGNQLEQMGLETDKAPQADNVISAADTLASKLQTMSQQIQSLRTDADRSIASKVSQINDILSNIDSLNDKISLASVNGGSPDLLDQRDGELLKLSQLIDIQYFERESGAVSIFTQGGTTLLDNVPKTVSHTGLTSVQPWDSDGSGDFDRIMVGIEDITDDIRSGDLRGLLDMRDGELVNMQAQIDELSSSLKSELNKVHNRGTSYPAMHSDYTGSRSFIDPANQQISIADSQADTAIVIFNSDGTQKAATTLKTIMGSSGPFTLQSMATNLQTWMNDVNGGGMTGATASFDSTGHFQVSLNSSGYGLAFRDQVSSVPGSGTSDLPISFDPTGGSTFGAYESAEGFSNFLGLNDFFTSDGQNNWLWQSQVLSQDYVQFGSTTMNLKTTDESGNVVSGSITVAAGDTLDKIAQRINEDTVLQGKFQVKASVVKEGTGVRLVLRNLNGNEIAITGTNASDNNFAALGMGKAATGQSTWLEVNPDLKLRPDQLANGIAQYNTDTGEYYVSAGDNANANAMATLFTKTQSFRAAGGMTTGNLTLSDFAGSIISGVSSRAAAVDSQVTYQESLATSLEQKNSEISSVNLDEELAKLIVYQQSYAAAAKVISTTKELFDILNDIVR